MPFAEFDQAGLVRFQVYRGHFAYFDYRPFAQRAAYGCLYAFDGHAFAAANADHQRLDGLGCGGDHRHRTDGAGHAIRQPVGAAFMTSQQRNGVTARFVQHHHGRVAVLVLRQAIEKAHGYAACRDHYPLRMQAIGCGKLRFLRHGCIEPGAMQCAT